MANLPDWLSRRRILSTLAPGAPPLWARRLPRLSRRRVSLEIITASLANSIAKNYLSKVVGTRKLGSKIILTGAVFYNQAVVSAF